MAVSQHSQQNVSYPTPHPLFGEYQSSSPLPSGCQPREITALRLVDGAGSGIVRGGQISEGKKDGGGGGAEATSVMYAQWRCLITACTNPQGAQAHECTLVHDPPAPWGQVHTLENVVPAPVTVWQPSS
ncbi:hypothetical protein Tco_0210627 [Tanacetum coccineum]